MLSGRGDGLQVNSNITFQPDTAAIRISDVGRHRYHPSDQFFLTSSREYPLPDTPFLLTERLHLGTLTLPIEHYLSGIRAQPELDTNRVSFFSMRAEPSLGLRFKGRFGTLQLDLGPFLALHNGGFDAYVTGTNTQAGGHGGVTLLPFGLPLEWSSFAIAWHDIAQSRFGEDDALTHGFSLRSQLALDIGKLVPNTLPAGSKLFVGGGIDQSCCPRLPGQDETKTESKGFVGISIPLP